MPEGLVRFSYAPRQVLPPKAGLYSQDFMAMGPELWDFSRLTKKNPPGVSSMACRKNPPAIVRWCSQRQKPPFLRDFHCQVWLPEGHLQSPTKSAIASPCFQRVMGLPEKNGTPKLHGVQEPHNFSHSNSHKIIRGYPPVIKRGNRKFLRIG